MGNWSKFSKWFLKRPETSGTFVFVFVFLFVILFVKSQYDAVKENQQREMSNILNVVQSNFDQILKNSYVTTLTLAMTVNDKGVPENFDKIAPKLLEANDAIDAVELVPNGIIKYVHPYEGNEAAINYDILHAPAVRAEALKSIKTKLIYFAGPLQLKQGGTAVVGRLPIFKKNKFWGFSAVIIRLETLIKFSGIRLIDTSKYYFQFSKINPVSGKEEFFFPNHDNFRENYFQTVVIPDGDWKLYIITRGKNLLVNQILTSGILGFLLSLICGLWVASIMRKPAQLQQKLDEQSLKILDREVEFKTLFDQAPLGIAKMDGETGAFIAVNKEFCRITGYDENQMMHLDFQKITHPNDLEESIQWLNKLKENSIQEFTLEKQYVHKSGKMIWVNLIVSKLRQSNQNKNNIAIIEDITEKKRNEEELRQSFELVSDQNKRLLNFSYIVSHNLRSHTSNIEMITTLLDITQSEEERAEMLDLLKKVSQSLNETMSNLNEVVSIRTNINLSIERLNLSDYIENASLVLGHQIGAKNAIVKNLVPPNIEIDYNTAYLESILFNLISNAIRYSRDGVIPQIILSFDEQTKSLQIADNGIGIDLEKNSEKLFGMYKTFNNNPDAKGIGLFIVKNQIDAMGGSITIQSKLNQGTTFTIFFK